MGYLLDALVHHVKRTDIEKPLVSPERLVTLDYLHGDVHQLDLERYTRLLAFRDNPRCAVQLYDVVGGQVFDVRERNACPAPEQEQVPRQCEVGIVQFDCTQRLDFVLREKVTLLVVGGNVVHCKRVSRYLAVVVRRGDDVLQRYGVYPHGRLRQPDFVSQVQAVVTYELFRQFIHAYVCPFVFLLNELRNISPDYDMFLVCAYGAVFAHPFGECLVLLVKSS